MDGLVTPPGNYPACACESCFLIILKWNSIHFMHAIQGLDLRHSPTEACSCPEMDELPSDQASSGALLPLELCHPIHKAPTLELSGLSHRKANCLPLIWGPLCLLFKDYGRRTSYLASENIVGTIFPLASDDLSSSPVPDPVLFP